MHKKPNQGGTVEIDDYQVMAMTVASGEFNNSESSANFPGRGTVSWTSEDDMMKGRVG